MFSFIFVKFWKHSAARKSCLQTEKAPHLYLGPQGEGMHTVYYEHKVFLNTFQGGISNADDTMPSGCSYEANCSQVPVFILMSYAL